MSQAPSGIEIAVFVWLLGFCFAEFKQLYKNGIKRYFSSGWNYVDIGTYARLIINIDSFYFICLD